MHICILPQCSTTAASVLNSAGMDAQFERSCCAISRGILTWEESEKSKPQGQTDLTVKAVNRSPCSPSYILLTFHWLWRLRRIWNSSKKQGSYQRQPPCFPLLSYFEFTLLTGVTLNKRIISRQEFMVLEKQMLEKYGRPENSIYRDYRIVKVSHST